MKLLLTLTTDQGKFITQVTADIDPEDLDLPATEFSFKDLLLNKAIETLQAEAQLEQAAQRFKHKPCYLSSEVH
jgi:hypothetical protein